MNDSFVGIYWTLPVNWIGFRSLPPNVDAAAAAASKTIRYQRERVRRHVSELGSKLIGEITFMDVRPDRATDAVKDVLSREAQPYARKRVALLAVRFADIHHWRHNPFLQEAADDLGLELIPLEPSPLTIDGKVFDPIRHFEAWRKRDERAMDLLRVEAREGLQAALADVPEGDGRWRAVADKLNRDGIRATRGGTWTAENVRKLAGRLPPADRA